MTNPVFYRRVMQTFEDMLDRPAAEQEAWLDRSCATEPDIAAAVRAMARANRRADLIPTDPGAIGSPDLDQPPPEQIGQYRIIAEIGRGGMGAVYRGERADGLFEHEVAIKLLRRTLSSERAQARFATERQILARLRHPHIAQMHDGGTTADGRAYIVMELIDGQPITTHCAAGGLDLTARLALFREAAGAVEHAHRNFIVHADIKPSNVVVEREFGVKLLDFGIARLLDEAPAGEGHGYTPGYASPERVAGQAVTVADDIFALGTLLREMVAGVAGVDDDLRAVVAKAADPSADGRYGIVGELLADLDRWQAHRPVAARPPGRMGAARLYWLRHRLGVVLGGTALLALLVGLAIVSTLYLRSERQRRLAEQRYAATQHMADYIIGNVDPALARMPGTLPLRRQLVERTGAYLHGLEADRAPPPALQREIAAGYLRLAKIYGLDPSGGIGDLPAAKADLAHAERLIDAAAAAEPDAPQLLVLRGRARLLAGSRIFVEPSLDIAKASIADLGQAQALLRRYARLAPDDLFVRLDLWQAQFMLSRDYAYLTQPMTGIGALEHTLALADMPVRNAVQRHERDFNLVASLLVLGENYSPVDPPRALRFFGLLDERVEQLRRQGQLDWETDLTQASGLVRRGQLEAKLLRFEAAASDLRRAVAILERLALSENSRNIQWFLSYQRSLLGSMEARLGHYAEAVRLSDASIAWLQRDAAALPGDHARMRTLGAVLAFRVQIEEHGGTRASLCAQAAPATALWRALDRLHATMPLDTTPSGLETIVRKGAATCSLPYA